VTDVCGGSLSTEPGGASLAGPFAQNCGKTRRQSRSPSHPRPAEAVGRRRSRGRRTSAAVTIITATDFSAAWLHDRSDNQSDNGSPRSVKEHRRRFQNWLSEYRCRDGLISWNIRPSWQQSGFLRVSSASRGPSLRPAERAGARDLRFRQWTANCDDAGRLALMLNGLADRGEATILARSPAGGTVDAGVH